MRLITLAFGMAATLAEVAKGGGEATMKESFKKTTGACNSCHDKYREEE